MTVWLQGVPYRLHVLQEWNVDESYKKNKKDRGRKDEDVKLTNQVKNGRMLKDRHIDAANLILRKQFPEVRGLKSPVMGQSSFPSSLSIEPPLHLGQVHCSTGVTTWTTCGDSIETRSKTTATRSGKTEQQDYRNREEQYRVDITTTKNSRTRRSTTRSSMATKNMVS